MTVYGKKSVRPTLDPLLCLPVILVHCLCYLIFKRAGEREVELRYVHSGSLIGQFYFLLVPNMVLSKMNNHEHRTKQTYESYTFQLIMSFWH